MNIFTRLAIQIFIGGNKAMFDKIRGVLKDKKTYLASLGTIIATIIAWQMGQMTPTLAFWAIMGALGLSGLKMKVSQIGGVFGKYAPYIVVIGQILGAVIKWTQDGNTMELITIIMGALGLNGMGNAVGKTINVKPITSPPNQ